MDDIVIELSYSVAFGYLGALLRYQLGYAASDFAEPSSYSEIAFVNIFRYQKFFLPNLISCFIMGILVAWSRKNPLFGGRKVYRDVFVGLTTGFCGCLSTFSSWLATFMSGSFNAFWFVDIEVLFVEFCTTWAIYCFGEYVYQVSHLIFSIWLLPITAQHVRATDVPQSSVQRSTGLACSTDAVTSRKVMAPMELTDQNSENLGKAVDETSFFQSHPRSPESGDYLSIGNDQRVFHDDEEVTRREIIEATPATTISTLKPTTPVIAERSSWEVLLTNVLIGTCAFSIAVLWIFVLIDAAHSDSIFRTVFVRDAMRSVAFSPFGASLRYLMKKGEVYIGYNSRFPWSTFLCNILGTFVAAIMLSYANEYTWTSSFITGFLGSWTTASSFMKELEELNMKDDLGPLYAIRYGFLSFAVAIVLVQLVRL